MKWIILKLVFVFGLSPAAFGNDAAVETAAKSIKSINPEKSLEASNQASRFGSNYSFGITSGLNSFGGNRGDLYDASSPSLGVEARWFFVKNFALALAYSNSQFSYDAAPNGEVSIDLNQLVLTTKYYVPQNFLGMLSIVNPSLHIGVSRSFRKQKFNSIDVEALSESDSANGLSVGLGLEYAVLTDASVNIDAKMQQLLFQDRFSQEFSTVGVEDQTGFLYSMNLGFNYFF